MITCSAGLSFVHIIIITPTFVTFTVIRYILTFFFLVTENRLYGYQEHMNITYT